MITSPLFRNLGLASGLDALEGAGDPVRPGTKVAHPNAPGIPLFVPKDARKLKIQDLRKLNPATGQAYSGEGPMSTSYNPDIAGYVIKHAIDKGVDPNTALAIALQETRMGNLDENIGSAWSTFPDEGITDPYEQGANSLAKTLADKMKYAQSLGYDKKGEAYALQAYNGYGKLFPRNTDRNAVESFYGIPVTHSKPLNMAQNPIYGKTIMSLRDEIIRKNSDLQKLIEKEMGSRKKTQPMQSPALTNAKR